MLNRIEPSSEKRAAPFLHLGTAAVTPHTSGALLLSAVEVNIAEFRRRTPAQDDTRSSAPALNSRLLTGDKRACSRAPCHFGTSHLLITSNSARYVGTTVHAEVGPRLLALVNGARDAVHQLPPRSVAVANFLT